MMRNLIMLAISLFMIGLFIFCGGDGDSKQNKDTDQDQATEERPKTMAEDGTLKKDDMTSTNPEYEGQTPPNPNLAPHGEEINPRDLEEGTCAYTAYWFAEYFTSGDSTEAYKLCNDSMTQHVRKVLQQPGQMRNMELNRAAGYKIEGVSIADESTETECRACLRATMMDQERVDCSFYFTKENGEWLLSSFAKRQ
ncbi:MAG: hypothetical protein GF310_13590 [candidate division Zixibacteria bacterium]|nr:hypothetical protein [candidate division Zixibacteria bacterium]